MFSRTLFVRSGFLRLPQLHSRALSSLRLSQPTRVAAPSLRTNLRQFSAIPDAHTKRTSNSPYPARSSEPSGTCFIANIPYDVTAEQLQEAFSEFGKVEGVRLMSSGAGVSKGAGFVQFESVADAVSFVEANRADPIFVMDRQLYVDHAENPMRPGSVPSNTLVVLGLQGESDAEVRSMFGSFADRILEVRFYKKEGSTEDKAFVQFRSVPVATDAMEAFKDQNTSGRVGYARHRQIRPDPQSLTSRLSQYRNE